MAMAVVDVVGSTPISVTDSTGAQVIVPLSALQFSGSDVQVKTAWTNVLDAGATASLRAVATIRAAAGELVPRPVTPPSPALLFSATHAGPESNGIAVKATSNNGGSSPLTTQITITATENDSYPGLATATDAAQAIGVDTAPAKAGDPPAGTGLVVVKAASVAAGTALPAAADQNGTLKPGGSFDVKAADDSVLFTLLPRTDYKGTAGLAVTVSLDQSGKTFTVTATYDSTKENGAKQQKVTILTLGSLPAPVGYLVKASPPSGGFQVPAANIVQLSGGGPGVAANGLLYTS
jgi:hypothetical protein